MRLLDLGRGPGTTWVGLADAVVPGELHGIGMEPSQIEMAAALIERLVHHCHIVNIRGNGYRMRDHQNLLQAGADRRRKKDGS